MGKRESKFDNELHYPMKYDSCSSENIDFIDTDWLADDEVTICIGGSNLWLCYFAWSIRSILIPHKHYGLYYIHNISTWETTATLPPCVLSAPDYYVTEKLKICSSS